MKAILKNYRQQPRKTRLVANFIRGKKVTQALTELSHLDKRAAGSFKKLIESAIANAKEREGIDREHLIIKTVRIDKGVTFKRFRPRARGRAAPINKRSSHILIILAQEKQVDEKIVADKVASAKKVKKETTKVAVKSTTKKNSKVKKTQTASV